MGQFGAFSQVLLRGTDNGMRGDGAGCLASCMLNLGGMASGNCSPKLCVLVIDDEETFLSFVKEALECQGYTVYTVSSPQEAIKFYGDRWREIDVALLDFWLPPMTGTLVFDALQRTNPNVRVVLVTGCNEPVAAELFQKGLRGFLRKPFSPSDLSRNIENA